VAPRKTRIVGMAIIRQWDLTARKRSPIEASPVVGTAAPTGRAYIWAIASLLDNADDE
jgi:hypothetical protein